MHACILIESDCYSLQSGIFPLHTPTAVRPPSQVLVVSPIKTKPDSQEYVAVVSTPKSGVTLLNTILPLLGAVSAGHKIPAKKKVSTTVLNFKIKLLAIAIHWACGL